jgi:hypothetical protein
MALETRSKPRQVIYLALGFVGLLGVLTLLTRWQL